MDVLGMFSSIVTQTLPARVTFCVYVVMTEGRGVGQGQIQVVEEDSDKIIYPGTPHELVFGANPIAVVGISIEIPCCTFPNAGLYRVDFMYNGQQLAHQPILVKEMG